jgi:CHAT domain-containing protein
VKKVPVDVSQMHILIERYRQQLKDWRDFDFSRTQEELYEILIRPIESEISSFSPEKLSFILTDELRYIPFESLYDSRAEKYLIEKYPVSYMTRLTSRSLNARLDHQRESSISSVLAIGNPDPDTDSRKLPGAEEEAQGVAQLFSNSELLLNESATLDAFKIRALSHPYIHLATHGCFDPQGCPQLDMAPNTILFSDQQYNIADAALLGLDNVELIVLSACQTAQQADADGEEISGLAYLFERAGAKSVIASLWNAEDRKTKEIMVKFYENLNQDMSKSEALQQAKIAYIDEHPFFWAPFVLIGDPR